MTAKYRPYVWTLPGVRKLVVWFQDLSGCILLSTPSTVDLRVCPGPAMVLVQGVRQFKWLFGCPHTTASAFLPDSPAMGWDMPEDVPLSDLTLAIKESGAREPPLSLRVHKLCLCRSDFFKAMLTSPLRESTQPVIEIEVPPHTRVAMLPVLAYLYDGVIDLDMDNVKPAHSVAMWRLADFLQVDDLKAVLYDQMKRCPDVFVAAVEQLSGDDGLITSLLQHLLSLSARDLDQSVVAENMMEFLEHPGFLPALIHLLPILPSASEGEHRPHQEDVLELLIGRHMDELPDSALASLTLRDLSLALWSQLQRPPCITDNQTGEVLLRWLSLTPEALASEDVRGLVGLLDLRQMSPDFVAHRLLAHPRVLACLDPLALSTMHQLADLSSSVWRQIFCPVSKRVMLPDAGSPWAPVKPWTCGHVVCAAYALENPTTPLEQQKCRALLFKNYGPDKKVCRAYTGCAGVRTTGWRKAGDAMRGYLRAYFKRRQERFKSNRAWVQSLQAGSEGTGEHASKKPRTESSPTGPSSEIPPQTQDGGVLIAVRRIDLEEDYRYLRVPSGLPAKELARYLLEREPDVQLPDTAKSASPWLYPDLFIKDTVETGGGDSNASHYRCLHRNWSHWPQPVENVTLKEGDRLELTEIGQGG